MKKVAIINVIPRELGGRNPTLNQLVYLLERNEDIVVEYFRPDRAGLAVENPNSIRQAIFHNVWLFKRLAEAVARIDDSFDYVIGIDTRGYLAGYWAARRRKSKLIYLSLEILPAGAVELRGTGVRTYQLLAKRWFRSFLKNIEYRALKKASLFLIQDSLRLRAFKDSFHAPIEIPCLFLPNSRIFDNAKLKKTSFLRDRLEIPRDKRILIYSGSIDAWTGGLSLFVDMDLKESSFCVVIHAPYGGAAAKDLALRKGFYIFSDFLDENEYSQMLASADVGLAWYALTHNPNIHYVGASGGKIFAYLASGLPVIVNDKPGLAEILVDKKAGLLVRNPSEIGPALRELERNLSTYVEGAVSAAKYYDFAKYAAPIIDFITHGDVDR